MTKGLRDGANKGLNFPRPAHFRPMGDRDMGVGNTSEARPRGP